MAREMLQDVTLKLKYADSTRTVANIVETATAEDIKSFVDSYNKLQSDSYEKIIRTATYELLNI